MTCSKLQKSTTEPCPSPVQYHNNGGAPLHIVISKKDIQLHLPTREIKITISDQIKNEITYWQHGPKD
jgi:hypothetical protein